MAAAARRRRKQTDARARRLAAMGSARSLSRRATAPQLKRDLAAAPPKPPRRSARAIEGKLAALPGAALGAAIARLRAHAGDARPGDELCLARPCRRHERSRDRPLLPDHAGAGERHRAPSCCSSRSSSTASRTPALDAKLAGAGAGALRALAARRARLPAAISSATSSRSCCTRNRSPAAPPGRGSSTRPRRRCAFAVGGKDLTSAEALHLLSERRSGDAQGGGQGAGRGVRQERAALRAHHQHARQGQGDRGPLARLQAADLVAQPRQFRRGRGGRRADRRGARRLSAACRIAITGSRRNGSASRRCPIGTATRRCPTRTTAASPGPRRSASCSTPMARSRPTWRRSGERFFDHAWIDAPVAAGQGARRLRASDGAERASLSAAQLPGQARAT